MSDIQKDIAELKKRLAELEAKVKENAEPKPTPEQARCIGRPCFYSDTDPACPNDGILTMASFRSGTLISSTNLHWNYWRPATYAELGIPWVEDAVKFIRSLKDVSIPHSVLWYEDIEDEARAILAKIEATK